MQKYKITASKSQKKYNFVLSAENEKLAKERIHKDGYSILNVELFYEADISKNTFIFEAEKSWESKKWKVIWDDIFKIYLKLKDGIWYDIKKLYSKSDENKDDKFKQNVINDLKEQYIYFKSNNKKGKSKEYKKEDKNEINIDNFYLRKELDNTYKLIDFVLKKLNNLLSNNKYELTDLKKEKLKNLYNSLVKIKSSTNVVKLKKIWEVILLKIWEIELSTLEKFKDDESKKFLKDTNNLLKQIWSDKKFVEENKDIVKQFKKVLLIIKDFLLDLKNKKPSKTLVGLKNKDRKTHIYLKNIIFLNKYKQKLKENNIDILKNIIFFIFPFWNNIEKKQEILIKRKVINQNVYLFKAKINWKVFSYTKTLNWVNYFLKYIFNSFDYIKDYLFFVVLSYSFLFILFLNINYYSFIPWLETSLNYHWVFYFIYFLFIYFAIYFSRGIYSLLFNFILLFFIFMFWIINF